jgi:hypothetical protein
MGAGEDKRRAAKNKNLKTALILASIAIVFLVGFFIRRAAG